MTFGEMQDRTRLQLNESTAAFYSDDDIALALNEGYAELADATEFYERFAYVPLLKKRTYYDLSLILPDTFLSPRRIYNPVLSRWLEPTDALALDHSWRQWELMTGTPWKYWLRGNWWLGVWPKPDVDAVGLRFYYTAMPPDMTVDDERPEFPEEFDNGLVEYALCDLLGQRRETKKALMHWTKYLDYQNRLLLYVNGRTQVAQA